jgi:hypothetical protein
MTFNELPDEQREHILAIVERHLEFYSKLVDWTEKRMRMDPLDVIEVHRARDAITGLRMHLYYACFRTADGRLKDTTESEPRDENRD